MKLNKIACLCLLLAIGTGSPKAAERIYDLAKMGLKADSKKNASPLLSIISNGFTTLPTCFDIYLPQTN